VGWGTFIAGQAIGTVRRAGRKTSEPILEPTLYWLNAQFFKSYLKRLLAKTVLIHPKIENKVDWDIWEEEITKKITFNWRLLVLVQIISTTICVIGFFPLVFINTPFFWYVGKNNLIKAHAKSINSEFKANGYEVEKLLAELPSIIQKNKDKSSENITKKRKSEEVKKHKRKFGK
jgi:hypothetical protein